MLEYLQEVETKILELQKHPSPDLKGHDLVALTEALSFVQHAIAAVSRTEKELQQVPEHAVRFEKDGPEPVVA